MEHDIAVYKPRAMNTVTCICICISHYARSVPSLTNIENSLFGTVLSDVPKLPSFELIGDAFVVTKDDHDDRLQERTCQGTCVTRSDDASDNIQQIPQSFKSLKRCFVTIRNAISCVCAKAWRHIYCSYRSHNCRYEVWDLSEKNVKIASLRPRFYTVFAWLPRPRALSAIVDV